MMSDTQLGHASQALQAPGNAPDGAAAVPPRPSVWGRDTGLVPEAYLAGGGEMGQRIRAYDWATTPLGPVETWPQSLRSAVSILLPSKAQIVLFWGPEFITLYNDAYAPTFGAKHPWALGRPAHECWSEVWHVLGPLFEGVVRTGEAFWAKDHPFFLQRQGFLEETYYDVSYDPVRIEDGSVGGVFCIVSEQTGRVLGERRLRTLRELGTRTADAKSAAEVCREAAAALAMDPADMPFALLYLSAAAEGHAALVGSSGVALEDLVFPWEVVLADVDALASTRQGRAVEAETAVFVRRAPETAAARVLVLPIASGTQIVGALVAGVSRFLRLAGDYRDFFDLALARIAAAIAHARAYEEERRRAEILAELDRAKTTFFSNVSHEFRTPLTLLLGPLEDLLATPADQLVPAHREILTVMHRNSLRLQKLVNTLLDFSRIEAGRMQAIYEPTDLAALTADLASTFRSACERAGLQLAVYCPPLPEAVYVDREMWEKLVLNLLSNAFKYTFAGEITVRLDWCGAHVALTVRDTGTGIPTHELPHIFERFHRIRNARARTHEGTGIGLALVQELARLHGGKIAVVSAVDVGTTFTVEIPTGTTHLPADRVGAARRMASTALVADAYVEEALRWLPEEIARQRDLEAPASHLPAPLLPSAPSGARILLADDNADMRDYVRRLLGGAYAVEAVADGEAAVRAALARPPDLILADVMMPTLDGFGVLQAVRADARMATIPVILLSARAGEESRIEGLEAGADDYLVKPFSARELQARVRGRLEIARLRREAAAQFETLLNAAPLGVYLVDADFRIRQVNPTALEVFGEIPALIGRDFDEVIHRLWSQEYADEIVRLFRHTLETGEPYGTPERIEERRDRRVTEYYEWQIHRIPLPEGRYGVVCYFRDISAQVVARQAIAASEARWRAMFEATIVGCAVLTPTTRFLQCNDAFCRLVGYTRDELLQCDCAALTHPDDRDMMRQQLARLMVGDIASCIIEKRYLRKDGTRIWVQNSVSLTRDAAGQPLHLIVLCQDVTERHHVAEERQRVAQALQQSNASLEQRVQERTALLALIQDVTRAANEAPSSAVALQYAVDRLCAYTGWPIGHVYLAVAPGAARWAPTALWHLDAAERFTAFQQATQALEVGAGEDLIGQVGACGQPEWQSEVASALVLPRRLAAQAAGLTTGVAWPILVGPEVAGVLECYTPEPLAPNPDLLEAMTQIGIQLGRVIERERAAEQLQRQQEALLQQEKLAAMSTMLANVAHELNNPLASMVLQAELLREDLRDGPLAESVAELTQAAARCERLVRQFLTLARQHPPERAVVALNTLVAETVEILAYPLRVDNVTVHLRLDDQVPPLWGDPHQLQQVLLNLLTNAQQALRAVAGPREVTCTTQYDRAQQQITLAVADTGPGMPPALQARIFEPFFTTKPPGVGTGLGLPLCRGIIEAHGGTLDVTSTPGHGATFRITLPLGTVPLSTPVPARADAAPVVRGGTILVVEDEVSLASGLARLLRRDGYSVDTVANGRLALAQLATRAYDLILCDVRMPELDGPSLYRLLERQQPHLCRRLIFLTGDTLEPATQAFLAASGAPCLAKPFAIAEARRVIQRTLQGAAPSVPGTCPP